MTNSGWFSFVLILVCNLSGIVVRAVSEDSVEFVPADCAVVDSNRVAVKGLRVLEGNGTLEIRKDPVKAEHLDRALHIDVIPRDIDYKPRIVESVVI
jgi:hypothetical protein